MTAPLAQTGIAEVREIAHGQTALAHTPMLALRPDLPPVEEFVRLVDDVQRPQGYRLVGSFGPGEDRPTAVCGFRTGHSLGWGRYLYIDDLSTRADARREGHATRLLDWLAAEAERLGCGQIHLDSGAQRHDAHRLYLGWGFVIGALHFRHPARR